MKALFLALFFGLVGASSAVAGLTVTTVHPLLTDMARQVGGSTAKIVPLMRSGEDVHHFEPSSSDISAIRNSDILLASGKGLELYLPKLQKSLGRETKIVQAGSAVRSLKVDPSSAVFVCCPAHTAGSVDPHWWHSITGTKKAVDYIAKEFGKADKANAKLYAANATSYKKKLDALNTWAKREIAKVPRSNRVLVTAHAAFGYFCKDFGFKSIPIAGLDDGAVSSKYLTEAIANVKKHNVTAVFPEQNSNARALNSIIAQTNVRKGGTLIPDGSSLGKTSYEGFVRHNVSTIVASLGR